MLLFCVSQRVTCHVQKLSPCRKQEVAEEPVSKDVLGRCFPTDVRRRLAPAGQRRAEILPDSSWWWPVRSSSCGRSISCSPTPQRLHQFHFEANYGIIRGRKRRHEILNISHRNLTWYWHVVCCMRGRTSPVGRGNCIWRGRHHWQPIQRVCVCNKIDSFCHYVRHTLQLNTLNHTQCFKTYNVSSAFLPRRLGLYCRPVSVCLSVSLSVCKGKGKGSGFI